MLSSVTQQEEGNVFLKGIRSSFASKASGHGHQNSFSASNRMKSSLIQNQDPTPSSQAAAPVNPLQAVREAIISSINAAANDYSDQNKLMMFQHSYNIPTRYQSSGPTQNTLPQLNSNQIIYFDLNPITKEILLISELELATFDVEKNEIIQVKSFKSLINSNLDPSPLLMNLGEQRLPPENKVKLKPINDKRKSVQFIGSHNSQERPSIYSMNGLNPSDLLKSPNQQSPLPPFQKPHSLNLYNKWAVIKNVKQIIFGDSNLMFSRDTISDSNGIQDMVINQKSEEIITLTKDMKQIRIWTYMVYQKIKPMPPIDELPVNVNHIEPQTHVFTTNKKNIHVNSPISQFCLNQVAELVAATSLESHSISIFTTMEGRNIYSLDYTVVNNGGVSGSDQVLTFVKAKYSHEQGYFSKPSVSVFGQQRDSIVNKMNEIQQMQLKRDSASPKNLPNNLLLSSNTPKNIRLSIQPIQTPKNQPLSSYRQSQVINFTQSAQTNQQSTFAPQQQQQQLLQNRPSISQTQSNTILNNFNTNNSTLQFQFMIKMQQEFLFILNKKTSHMIVWDLALENVAHNLDLLKILSLDPRKHIAHIYPQLSNIQSGLVVIDSDQFMYDISLTAQCMIEKSNLGRTKNLIYKSFTKQLHSFNELKQTLQRSTKEAAAQEIINNPSTFDPMKFLKNEFKKHKSINREQKRRFYHIRHCLQSDGCKQLFILQEGTREIQILTYFSGIDIYLDLLKNHRDEVVGVKYVFHQPLRYPFIKDNVNFNDLIPFIDHNNSIHLLKAKHNDGEIIYSMNFTDMVNKGKSITDVPCLPDRHKHRKQAFYEETNKFFTYDIRLRIAVFIDTMGMCCVLNTHYKTKKFVFLEDKYKVKEIIIMPKTVDISPYQEQLHNKIPSSEEIERKDNIYKLLEDFPDFDFLVTILSIDGWVIVLSNESQFQDLRIAHRINLQTAILQTRYIPDKNRLVIIVKEGVFRIYEPYKDMTVVKQFNMLWPDVSALDMKSDELIIAGHESGMIYTQPIKGEIKISEMQIHNFHLSPILHIALPVHETTPTKFIALSKDNSLTLFSMDQDRPLRVMKFQQQFQHIIFLGKKEVVAFTNHTIFRIDLINAQPYSENFKALKKDWIDFIEKRTVKNQYLKKTLQFDEQRNDQFYNFQNMKKSYVHHHPDYVPVPMLCRQYYGLTGYWNIYYGQTHIELDHILSKKHIFPFQNYLFIEQLRPTIENLKKFREQQLKQLTFKKGKAKDKNQEESAIGGPGGQSSQSKSGGPQRLDSATFNMNMKQIGKLNKGMKSNLLNLDKSYNIRNQIKTSQESERQRIIDSNNFYEQVSDERSLLSTAKFENRLSLNLDKKQSVQLHSNRLTLPNQGYKSNKQLEREIKDEEQLIPISSDRQDLIKNKFQMFLTEVQKQSDLNMQKMMQEKQGIKSAGISDIRLNGNIIGFEKERQSLQTSTQQYMMKRTNTQHTLQTHKSQQISELRKNALQMQQSQPQLLPNPITRQISLSQIGGMMNSSKQIVIEPPRVTMTSYTKGLYALKSKIKQHEERAQTAASNYKELERKMFSQKTDSNQRPSISSVFSPQQKRNLTQNRNSEQNQPRLSLQSIDETYIVRGKQEKPSLNILQSDKESQSNQSQTTFSKDLNPLIQIQNQQNQQPLYPHRESLQSQQSTALGGTQVQGSQGSVVGKSKFESAQSIEAQPTRKSNHITGEIYKKANLEQNNKVYTNQFRPLTQQYSPEKRFYQGMKEGRNGSGSAGREETDNDDQIRKYQSQQNDNNTKDDEDTKNRQLQKLAMLIKQIPPSQQIKKRKDLKQYNIPRSQSMESFAQLRKNARPKIESRLSQKDFPVRNEKNYLKERNSESVKDLKIKYMAIENKVQARFTMEETMKLHQRLRQHKGYDEHDRAQQNFFRELLEPKTPDNNRFNSINTIQEYQDLEDLDEIVRKKSSKEIRFLDNKYEKVAVKPSEHKFNLKANQKERRTKSQEKSHRKGASSQDKSLIDFEKLDMNKKYNKALKKYFQDEKIHNNGRINLMEKKAQLEQGKKLLSPLKINLQDQSQHDADKIKHADSDSQSDSSNKVLNEEQRSIIVEEILKIDDELIFEDFSSSGEDENNQLESEKQRKNSSFMSKGSKNKGATPRAGDRSVSNRGFGAGVGESTFKQKVPKIKKLKIFDGNEEEYEKQRAVRLRDLENAAEVKRLNIQLQNDRLKQIRAVQEGLDQDFLKASKMQITKQTKKEKKAQKYFLMKEFMREKVSISRDKTGFQIIIPKSMKYGKPNLRNIDAEEFAQHYTSYRVNIKDIINLIREQEDMSQTDYISKEKVAAYLKKNLQKLLTPDDPKRIEQDKQLREQLEKMEAAQQRKQHRDLEKLLKRQKYEDELESRKERIKREKDDALRKRLEQQDQKKKEITSQLYKTVDSSQELLRQGTAQKTERGKKPSIGEAQIQMIIATNLQIAERKTEINKRLEHLRMERELERIRQEQNQIYNYVREVIVKGTIINNVIKHIRRAIISERKSIRSDMKTFWNPDFNKIKSAYSQSFFQHQKTNKMEKLTRNMTRKTNQSGMKQTLSQNSVLLQESMNKEMLEDEDSLPNKSRSSSTNSRISDEIIEPPIASQIQPEPQPPLEKIPTRKSREEKDKKMFNIDLQDNQFTGRGKDKNSIKSSLNTPGKISQIPDSNRPIVPKTMPPKSKSKFEHLDPKKSLEADKGYYYYYDEEDNAANSVKPPPNLHSRTNSQQQKLQSKNVKVLDEENVESEYGDEQNDDIIEDDSQKNSSMSIYSKVRMARQSPRKISIFPTTDKINDYALELISTPGITQDRHHTDSLDGGGIMKLEDDMMSPEEEALKIELEMQYQRILEKITEKIMSRKITSFKKELLIRIALNLEQMEKEDLNLLEKLLERFESNDPDVKRKIIELFQIKYMIDLSADLNELVEDQMNKVKDETRGAKQKHIKELLLKKFRMLNMISRFCKVSDQAAFKKATNSALRNLKDLLDQDEAEHQSDDDEETLRELQENCNEILTRLFQKDEIVIQQQLKNYKKHYKMKFGQQPEYFTREEAENDFMNSKEYQAAMRVAAFIQQDKKLKEVLGKYLHPRGPVVDDELYSKNMSKNKRKLLYAQDNDSVSSFYDLAAEIMNRLAKVKSKIKIGEKNLQIRHKSDVFSKNSNIEEELSDDGQDPLEDSKEILLATKKINLKKLDYRRNKMTDQELLERQYCALRIAEHLHNNILEYPEIFSNLDEEFDLPKTDVVNIMDPRVEERLIERDMIEDLRKEKMGMGFEPLMKIMGRAFVIYMRNYESTREKIKGQIEQQDKGDIELHIEEQY